MREPVFSGYYGGTNQYPVISGAMFSLIDPAAVAVDGGLTTISLMSESYATSKKAMTFLKMTGKGMTLKKSGKNRQSKSKKDC